MWRRLPTFFPNLRLQMLPLTPEQRTQLLDTGWLREVAFKCEPRVNKLEIKAFLEAVHGMQVERVNTINYQGKKKREIDEHGKAHYFRRSDWKKAYVLFKPPEDIEQKWKEEQQEKQQQRLNELKEAALARSRLPNFLPAAAAAVAKRAAPEVATAAAVEMQAAQLRRASKEEEQRSKVSAGRSRKGSKKGKR